LKLFLTLLVLFPLLIRGQKIGDSISFNTIYNSVYNGTIEKIDSDGFFFKGKKNRILYLKNMEINSFQKIPHSLKNSNENSSSIKNPENEVPTKNSNITKELQDNFIDIDKLSSYTGKNIIIHLKDGRNLEGVIIKIIYDIDLIGKKYEVVKFLNSNKKMSINTFLIESVETSK